MQDFVGSVASSGPPQKKRRLSTTASGSTERSEDSPVTPSTDNSPNSSVLHKVCTPSPDGQAPSSTTTRQSSLLQHKQSTATRVPRWIDALLADWEEAIAGTLETGRGDFLQSLPVLPKVADAIRKRSCEALVLRPQNSLGSEQSRCLVRALVPTGVMDRLMLDQILGRSNETTLIRVLEYGIAAGLDVNIKDASDKPCFCTNQILGNPVLLNWFINHGADLNSCLTGLKQAREREAIFLYVIMYGSVETLHDLLDYGHDPQLDSSKAIIGASCSSKDTYAKVRLLVKKGFDIDRKGESKVSAWPDIHGPPRLINMTALHTAVANLDVEVGRMLLRQGADPRIDDDEHTDTYSRLESAYEAHKSPPTGSIFDHYIEIRQVLEAAGAIWER